MNRFEQLLKRTQIFIAILIAEAENFVGMKTGCISQVGSHKILQ